MHSLISRLLSPYSPVITVCQQLTPDISHHSPASSSSLPQQQLTTSPIFCFQFRPHCFSSDLHLHLNRVPLGGSGSTSSVVEAGGHFLPPGKSLQDHLRPSTAGSNRVRVLLPLSASTGLYLHFPHQGPQKFSHQFSHQVQASGSLITPRAAS